MFLGDSTLSYVKDKNKNQILDEMEDTALVGSLIHEQQRAAISVRCTEDIETALAKVETQLKLNSESSDRVGNKLFWLNVVLASATIVAAVATVIIAIKT
jgi:hypothetical protein